MILHLEVKWRIKPGNITMSDSSSSIQWSRKPYTISYQDLNGEKKTIRRVPPEKLHEMLPTDQVELKYKKNDDFLAGDTFKVKHINPRHPNVLQLVNDEEMTTFVDYYHAELIDQGTDRPGINAQDRTINNRYLLWP
jgi:hypothetical protein